MSALPPVTDIDSVEQRHLHRPPSTAAGGLEMVKGPEWLLLSCRTAKVLIEWDLDSLPDQQRSVLSRADDFIERSLSVASQIEADERATVYDSVGPLEYDADDQAPVCSELADAIVADLQTVDPSADSSALDVTSRIAELLQALYIRPGGLDAKHSEDSVCGEPEALLTAT